MAIKMRKALALVLALALCAGQLSVPALAEITEETVNNPDGTVTVTITEVVPMENGETVNQTATTTGENILIEDHASDSSYETEDAYVNEGSGNTEITESNIPTDDVQQDVVLNPEAEPVPQEGEEPTPIEPESQLTEGEWTDEGEAADSELVPGEPTEEVLGELEGQTTEGELELENLLTEDPDDDVILDFEAPTGETPDEAEVSVQIEVDLAAEYEANGYTVTPIYEKDADGNDTDKIIGMTATKKTLTDTETTTGEVVEGQTTEGTPDEGKLVADSALDEEADKGLQNVATDADNVTKTTEMVKSGGENPTYTRTTTTVTTTSSTGEPIQLTEDEKAALASSTRGESTTTYIYPTVTEQADETYEDGSATRFTYKYETDEQGNVISITEIQENVAPDGTVLAVNSYTMNTTIITTTPITIVDPVTKVETTFTETTEVIVENITNTEYTRTNTTEISRTDETTNTYEIRQDTYTEVESEAMISDGNGNYFVIYNGKMYAVVDEGSAPVDTHPTVGGSGSGSSKGDEWEHVGTYQEGEDVSYVIWKEDYIGRPYIETDGTTAQLFKLKNGKEVRAVYCIELEQTTNKADYNVDIFEDNTANDGNASWGGNIRQVISVAQNGYFGTSSGAGSLEAVKSLLRRHQDRINANGGNLTDKDIEKLTAADAITATQVALWEYGSKDDKDFTNKFSDDKTIVTLRNLLLELAEEDAANNVDENGNYQGAAQELNADAIDGAAIQLKNTVVDEKGEAQRNEAGQVLYNTDVIIKMNISESSINGNLLVTVTDSSGNTLGTYRLAEDGSGNLLTNAAAGVADALTGTKQVKANGNGTYTLSDLILPDGTRFTVNLSGTQHLDDGVTIYMNKNHQDFVGLVSKDKAVDLSFDMEFSVIDPELATTSGTYTQTGTSQQTYTGTRSQNQTKTDVLVTTTGTVSSESEVLTTFYGDISVVNEKVTESSYAYYSAEYKTQEENQQIDPPGEVDPPEETPPGENNPPEENPPADDGDAGVPMLLNGDFEINEVPGDAFPVDDAADANGEIEILDEDVPLAAAPITGDLSGLWAAISFFSLGGAAVLSRKKEEE